MIYILDTDVFTLGELPESQECRNLHARILEIAEDDQIVTTIVTYEEQMRGWLAYAAKSRAISHQLKAYDHLKKHLESYKRIDVLDFDAASAMEYERLVTLRLRIGTADLKIAAIVLANDATLLSRNHRDFKKVEGLRVEDWTA